jgi:hypothetical protein
VNGRGGQDLRIEALSFGHDRFSPLLEPLKGATGAMGHISAPIICVATVAPLSAPQPE